MNYSNLLTVTALACASIACNVPCAFADQIVLTPVADNTLIQDTLGNYSCGAAGYFFAGRVGVNGGSTIRRGAVRFDLSAILPFSTITSVTLKLNCSAAGTTASQPIGLKKFSKSWGEGASVAFGGGGTFAEPNDLTWLSRFYGTTQNWTTPGGDFSATISATKNVTTTGSYTWASTATLVADVQSWVNAPTANYGWCVQGNEVTLQAVKRFDSREVAVAAYKPQLTVIFTPAPPNPYDLTHDGFVNAADLASLLSQWGTAGAADFNSSGAVDGADLASILSAWTG